MILHVRRGDRAAGELVTYDLAAVPGNCAVPDWSGASVSTALKYIQRHLDPDLAYLLSCRRGLCNICALKVDGTVRAACVTPLRSGMVIEPTRGPLLLRDTITELSLVRKARIMGGPVTEAE